MKKIVIISFLLSLLSFGQNKTHTDLKVKNNIFIDSLKKIESTEYRGKVPEKYYTYPGIRDWWRFPLVYPFAIQCIESVDKGHLVSEINVNYNQGGSYIIN